VQALKYQRATTIDQAVQLLADSGSAGHVLAGGTDIIVQARARRIDVDLLVDIKGIPELSQLSYDAATGLTVGAAVPCYRIYGDADVQQHYPVLVDCTSLIGGTAIQGRASIGGNLCNASPSGDSIPTMIVLEGTANIAGPNGTREVPVEDFCTGPGESVLQSGEVLVSVHFPPPVADSGARFLRFIPRNEMDIAVVNSASALRFDGDTVSWARVAVGAAAPTPLLVDAAATALIGGPLTDDSIAAAAAAAREATSPIDDMRGTIKQRRHLAAVLTERTLRGAAERAGR
jgi:carbon-monoxide dehydrogenase medium subunit